MSSYFTYILYGITAVLLGISFLKDKAKTLLAIKKAWNFFIKILPQFVTILLIVSLLLTVIKPDTIQRILGAESGISGILISSFLGMVTLVPVIIAFPVTVELLNNGAGIAQTAVFVSTLTMVGLVTLSMEIRYLGKKVAFLRNGLAYLFAFITAYIMGLILV